MLQPDEADYDSSALKENPITGLAWRELSRPSSIISAAAKGAGSAEEKYGQFYNLSRRIHYDTDNISENQEVRQRLCDDCCSYREIASLGARATGGRYRVLCYSIPLYSCAACREEALAAYRDSCRKGGGGFDYIYLQDRAGDDYRRFDCARDGEESIT